jgi:hyperosmotically inducible periplasmic protein
MMNGRQSLSPNAAALLMAALMTTPVSYAGQDNAKEPTSEFKRLDVNRDGYVSRDEARKLKNFEKAFTDADDNRDGRLDADEFVKAQSIYDRMRAEQFVEDSVITARVKTALLKDPQVSALDVKVETYRGTVLLSGFVDDEKQAQRAVEIASGVRGVSAVQNGLAVKG